MPLEMLGGDAIGVQVQTIFHVARARDTWKMNPDGTDDAPPETAIRQHPQQWCLTDRFAQPDVFQSYAPKDIRVAEALGSIEDLYSGDVPVRGIVHRNTIRHVFRCDGGLDKPDVKGVDFWIVGYPHGKDLSLLEIVYINRHHDNFFLFSYEDRTDLFGLVELTVPLAPECKVLAAFKPIPFGGMPSRSPYGFQDLVLGCAAEARVVPRVCT